MLNPKWESIYDQNDWNLWAGLKKFYIGNKKYDIDRIYPEHKGQIDYLLDKYYVTNIGNRVSIRDKNLYTKLDMLQRIMKELEYASPVDNSKQWQEQMDAEQDPYDVFRRNEEMKQNRSISSGEIMAYRISKRDGFVKEAMVAEVMEGVADAVNEGIGAKEFVNIIQDFFTELTAKHPNKKIHKNFILQFAKDHFSGKTEEKAAIFVLSQLLQSLEDVWLGPVALLALSRANDRVSTFVVNKIEQYYKTYHNKTSSYKRNHVVAFSKQDIMKKIQDMIMNIFGGQEEAIKAIEEYGQYKKASFRYQMKRMAAEKGYDWSEDDNQVINPEKSKNAPKEVVDAFSQEQWQGKQEAPKKPSGFRYAIILITLLAALFGVSKEAVAKDANKYVNQFTIVRGQVVDQNQKYTKENVDTSVKVFNVRLKSISGPGWNINIRASMINDLKYQAKTLAFQIEHSEYGKSYKFDINKFEQYSNNLRTATYDRTDLPQAQTKDFLVRI